MRELRHHDDPAIPPPEVLSCGCFMDCVIVCEENHVGEHPDGERQLRYSPCRPDCLALRAGIEIAKELGRPVRYEEAP